FVGRNLVGLVAAWAAVRRRQRRISHHWSSALGASLGGVGLTGASITSFSSLPMLIVMWMRSTSALGSVPTWAVVRSSFEASVRWRGLALLSRRMVPSTSGASVKILAADS